MRKFIKIFLATLCLSVICPVIAEAQFGKTVHNSGRGCSNGFGRSYGRQNDNAYIRNGIKFGIDIDNGYCLDEGYELSALAKTGYQLNSYFYCGLSIGGGVGLSPYVTYDGMGHEEKRRNESFEKFIVAADFCSYLTKTRVAPMLSFNIGYMLYDGESQLFVSGGVGARFGITPKTGVSVQFITQKVDDCPVLGARIGFDF